MHADSVSPQRGEKTESIEREAPCFESLQKKPASASLSLQLFKGYDGLRNDELRFLLKKGNIGELMK